MSQQCFRNLNNDNAKQKKEHKCFDEFMDDKCVSDVDGLCTSFLLTFLFCFALSLSVSPRQNF